MKYEDIKFFSERCEEHPDHQSGMISNSMIQQRLHEEIDELRAYIESQLAQPEQEPVAWMDKHGDVLSASVVNGKGLRNIPLYTTPPQIEVGCAECGANSNNHGLYCVACAERYLKDKNIREKQCQDKKVK